MRTANYSEFRNNLKTYLNEVINDHEPLVPHRQGNESVVVLSLADYNAISESQYIMSSHATMQAIAEGIRELNEGKKIEQQPGESVDDFLARL